MEGSAPMGSNGEARRYTPALTALLSKGAATLVPDEWMAVLVDCKRLCEQEGDARYCILLEAFERLGSWRSDHDNQGGVPTVLLNNIGELVDSRVPDVLSQSRADLAAQLATSLRNDLSSRLLSFQEWKL
jgi:hypothetical protein